MVAVQNAVQNGIENLSGTSITTNAHPEDGYRFNARTKTELLTSQQLAADAREVGAKERAQDPAVTRLQAPAWEDVESPVAAPKRTPPKAKQPEGWIL